MRTSANGHFSIRYKTSGDSSARLLRVDDVRRRRVFHVAASRPPVVTRRRRDAHRVRHDVAARGDQARRPARHHRIARRERPAADRRGLRSSKRQHGHARRPRQPDAGVERARAGVGDVAFSSIRAASLPPARSRGGARRLDSSCRSVRAFARSRSPTSCRASAFPLAIPVERPTGVFEMLIQEPTARVEGPSLREMAPVLDRRAHLSAVPRAGSVGERRRAHRDAAHHRRRARARLLRRRHRVARRDGGVARLRGATLGSAPRRRDGRSLWSRRRARSSARSPRSTRSSSEAPRDDAARDAYQAKRASLKSELAAALAAERTLGVDIRRDCYSARSPEQLIANAGHGNRCNAGAAPPL